MSASLSHGPWMTRIAIALCALSCWLCAGAAFALDPDKAFAHYVADDWSIQAGLPQISVLTIAQDPDGYIWVGTQNGLARFDGVRFTTFTPETTPALPGIWIRALRVDREGRLWIGTYKGLAMYADGRFVAVPAADAAAHPHPDVFAIRQADDGAIVTATGDGLLRVDGGKLVAYGTDIKPAMSLLQRDDGLWVGSVGAVMRVAGGQTTRLPLPAGATTAEVTRLVEAQGRVWAGTSQGLFEYTDDRWSLFDGDPKLANAPIGALYEDHDHNLWAGTNLALLRLREGRLVESIASLPQNKVKDIRSAFEDREGNLWLGSQVNGLIRVWNGWTRRYSEDDGLSDPVVWSLTPAANGAVWVGTSNGVSLLDHGRFSTVETGVALPHPHAYSLFAESNALWIGTRHGLAVLRDGRLETPSVFAPMAGAQVNGIARQADRTLWFMTMDGLFRLDREGQPDARLRQYGPADGLGDLHVRAMLQLRDGRVLVGTESGLYERRGERFAEIGTDRGLPHGLDINTIHELASGAIALGVSTEQLFVFDDGRWRLLGAAQGVPANSTFFMAEDDRGFLWMAGIRGVARVPVADLTRFARGEIRQVRGEMILNERGDRNAGQQGFCCNGAGLSKGYLDGHVLWLPSRDGVVALDTHGIVKNPHAPNVAIERVVFPGGFHDARAMPDELPASERDLAFEFTTTSFQDPQSIQLRYRLDGYDRDWHVLDDPGRRRANYTNLPAGDYVFEVMGANNAGVWNPAPARLAFRIRPYFHETRLFDLLMLTLLGVLVYAGYRWQHQRHEAQRVLLERQVLERTQQLHTANERLENASQTDPLTGLRNRRYLANQIPADLAWYDRDPSRADRSASAMLFALVNIDGFSAANERLGRRNCDRVLQQFAQMLAMQLRGSDYVVRWNSDEFLVVSRPMPAEHAGAIGARIHAAVARNAFYLEDGQAVLLTASIGMALYPLHYDAGHRPGWEQMVELAGAALHWVKQRGRDGWAIFRPGPRADLHALLRDLHEDPQALLDSGRALCESSSPGDASRPRG